MPRRGVGPRPVMLLSPVDRTLYEALVAQLRGGAVAVPRPVEPWKEHQSFGLDRSDDEYLVEFDIASCYEYIEFATLRKELISQTLDTSSASLLTELLQELSGRRGRGIPQLLPGSDALAETYLSAIARHLARYGLPVSRYADDFKVIAPSWVEAHAVIERAAEIAREYGFVLSTQKTKIQLVETAKEANKRLASFMLEKFAEAREGLTFTDLVSVGYDDWEFETVEPDFEATAAEGFRRIIDEWVEGDPYQEDPKDSIRSKLVRPALRHLANDERRVESSSLEQVVFRTPLDLQQVCAYLAQRGEAAKNWEALRALTSMGRQSPWAKLWLLSTASGEDSLGTDDEKEVVAWATAQLADRHEVVRAEAAWFCAARGSLDDDQVLRLYMSASEVSRPAIAAAAARYVGDASDKRLKPLADDSKLNRIAIDWVFAEDS
ncbi:reverse transcriptase domain-containing protein [Agromyces sp. ZXT2-6]|uniref:reverse transcriptase domain-containing protein n=1 Tax=Agromyces sp. ZXT2-6 TaxID=3461153 RepID=UPI004054A8C5